MVCSRCGKANDPESRYCSACGMSLLALVTEESPESSLTSASSVPSSTPRQYSPEDIEELLILRKVVKREDRSAKVLKQDDVDKLFE
jgi:uncharacterized OB-fold protein